MHQVIIRWQPLTKNGDDARCKHSPSLAFAKRCDAAHAEALTGVGAILPDAAFPTLPRQDFSLGCHSAVLSKATVSAELEPRFAISRKLLRTLTQTKERDQGGLAASGEAH